jgi:hypothetical protein
MEEKYLLIIALGISLIIVVIYLLIKKIASSKRIKLPPELDIEVTPEMMFADCPKSDEEVKKLYKEKKLDKTFKDGIKQLFQNNDNLDILLKYHKTQVFRYNHRFNKYKTKEELQCLGRHQFLVNELDKKSIRFKDYLLFGVYYDLLYDIVEFGETYETNPVRIENMIRGI